jgi:hypothetical protein
MECTGKLVWISIPEEQFLVDPISIDPILKRRSSGGMVPRA